MGVRLYYVDPASDGRLYDQPHEGGEPGTFRQPRLFRTSRIPRKYYTAFTLPSLEIVILCALGMPLLESL